MYKISILRNILRFTDLHYISKLKSKFKSSRFQHLAKYISKRFHLHFCMISKVPCILDISNIL